MAFFFLILPAFFLGGPWLGFTVWVLCALVSFVIHAFDPVRSKREAAERAEEAAEWAQARARRAAIIKEAQQRRTP
jgi:hypothetical protein